MVSSQEQSELCVTATVFHGSTFDLDCHVKSTAPSTIYWYIVTDPEDEIIYTYNSLSGNEGTGDNDHLVGRSLTVNKVNNTFYNLHIDEADRNKDSAFYKCKHQDEIISDEKEVYVYSK